MNTLSRSAVDMRRHVAESILNKASADPEWKARLINDPQTLLAEDIVGHEIKVLIEAKALAPLPECCISCCFLSL
jgi:hypothetical protein